MGRTKTAYKRILKVLKEEKSNGKSSMSVVEIRDEYKNIFGRELSTSVLYENMPYLLEKKLVKQTIFFPKGEVQGIIQYQLTKSYFCSVTKDKIINQINKVEKINKDYMSDPAIYLDTELDFEHADMKTEKKLGVLYYSNDKLSDSQADVVKTAKKRTVLYNNATLSTSQAVAKNFTFFAYKTLTDNKLFNEKERKKLNQLIGTLVRFFDDQLDPSSYIEDPFEFLGLDNLFKEILDDNEYRIRHFRNALRFSLVHLIEKEDTTKVSRTAEDAKNFFAQNRSLFERFVKELKKIKFMILIYHGIPELEDTWDISAIEEFECWFAALKAGTLRRPVRWVSDENGDRNEESDFLYTTGVKRLRKRIRQLRKENRTLPDDVKIDHDLAIKWSLLDLYRNHRESVELYEEILAAVLEDKKRKEELPNA